MKSKRKRILSMFLAAAIIVSSVPSDTFASNITDEAYVNEVIRTEEPTAEPASEVQKETEQYAKWPEKPIWVRREENGVPKVDTADGTYTHRSYGLLKENVTEQGLAAMQQESNALAEDDRVLLAGTQIQAGWIDHKIKIYINGREFTEGDVKVTKGDNFSYTYSWQPNYPVDKAPADGDWFEYVLFKVPHLNLPQSMSQPLVINGIKVGDWALLYNRSTGEMKYRVTFNRYIQMFDLSTVLTQLQGSGSFAEISQGTKIEYNGQTSGLVILDNRPVHRPTLPSGTGWKPPVIQFENKIYPFGKGIKWNSGNNPNAVPQIDWRVVFFEQLQKRQESFLDGTPLTPTSGYCIVEETLDENQRFHRTEEKEFGSTPFHIELPVITVGTSQLLNGNVGYGGGDGTYDGPGTIAPYIRGADLKEIDGSKAATEKEVLAVQNEVRKTPCSWSITLDLKTKKQTLLINLGVLGGKDSSQGITWSMSRGAPGWPDQGIQSRINQCEGNIHALASGDNSPISLMDERHQNVVNLLLAALNLPDNNDMPELKEKVEAWRKSYRTWREDKRVDALAQLVDKKNQVIVPLPDITLLEQLAKVPINRNGTTLEQNKGYQDFKLSYANILNDQKTYLDNRLLYKQQWEDAKGRYEKTKAFYEGGPIYGFALKIRTKSINTSVKQYRNQANISVGDQRWAAEDKSDIVFANRTEATFGLGAVLIQKAEQCYDVKTPGVDPQMQELENIKKVEADRAGIPGAHFKVYCAVGQNNEFVKDEKYEAHFMNKDASPHGDTYIYSHTGNTPTGGMIPGEQQEVITDGDGKIILGGLTPLHDHFLVETQSPQGYYVDGRPIRIKSEQDKVIYDLVPNVTRGVRLNKVDSFSRQPVSGAEFALYKVNEQNEKVRITEMGKKHLNGKEVYIPKDQGTERLYTNEKGLLCIHNLDAGTYVLEEIAPAPGYLPPPSKPISYTFTLQKDLPASKVGLDDNYHVALNGGKPVENDPGTATVKITKMDGRTSNLLSDAGYAFFRFNGTEEEWVKNPNDSLKWEKVDLNPTRTGRYFHTGERMGTVTMPNLPGGDTPFEVAFTNAQGTVTLSDIPIGHYSLAEVKAPDTYQRDYTNYYFDVTKDNIGQSVRIFQGLGTAQKEVVDGVFHNYRRNVFLKLVKGSLDQMPETAGIEANGGVKYEGAKITGQGLSGAVYKLFMRKGSANLNPDPAELISTHIVGGITADYDDCVAVGTTDANGVLDLKHMTDAKGVPMTDGLHMGNYYMIEVQAPDGYILDQSPISFKLDENVFPTDSNGEILEKGIPGLVKSAVNHPYVYGIRLVKKDAVDKEVIGGAGFEISLNGQKIHVKSIPGRAGRYEVDTSGTGTDTLMRTNESGILSITGLQPGTAYTLEETQVPNGYKQMAPFTITTPASANEGTVEHGNVLTEYVAENERLKGAVFLHKQDEESGEALQGAEFQLYRVTVKVLSPDHPEYHLSNQGATQTIEEPVGLPEVTDQQGNLTIENLDWGTYYLVETKAPKGYALSQKKHGFIIGKDSVKEGEVLKVSFPYVTNSKQIGSAKLRKVDPLDPGKILQGVRFGLWKKILNPQGEEDWVRYGTEERVTDEKGEIVFRLPPGIYKVIELQAPEGYLQPIEKDAETIFEIVPNPAGGHPQAIEFEVMNHQNLQSLKIQKEVSGVMGDKTRLFTFEITLTNSDGTPFAGNVSYQEQGVEKQLTFVDGKAEVQLSHGQNILLEKIPYGLKYQVVEKEADKDGYTTTYNGLKDIPQGVLNLENKGVTEVKVVNHCENVPQTGLFHHSSGNGMMVGIGLLGLVFLVMLFLRRRRGI